MILPILLDKTKLLPIYVVRIGITRNQYKISREDGFNSYQILYCVSGSGIFKVGGKSYKISSGDAFFFRPGVPHEYIPVEKPWKTTWITYSGSSAEGIADYLGLGDTAVFSIPNLTEFDLLTKSLSDVFISDKADKEIRSSCILYKMLIKVGGYIDNLPQNGGMTQNEKFQKISPVIDLMKRKYNEDISLETMADEIGVTANHLCRLFNQVYGVTPLKYLTQLRLNEAKNFLSSSDDMKIKDIAAATGFNGVSYFCTVFKKYEGVTPEVYRRINIF